MRSKKNTLGCEPTLVWQTALDSLAIISVSIKQDRWPEAGCQKGLGDPETEAREYQQKQSEGNSELKLYPSA